MVRFRFVFPAAAPLHQDLFCSPCKSLHSRKHWFISGFRPGRSARGRTRRKRERIIKPSVEDSWVIGCLVQKSSQNNEILDRFIYGLEFFFLSCAVIRLTSVTQFLHLNIIINKTNIYETSLHKNLLFLMWLRRVCDSKMEEMWQGVKNLLHSYKCDLNDLIKDI